MRSIGLPGNVGEKSHYWFVVGHAAGLQGRPRSELKKMSRACIKAYNKGYDKGVKERD